MKIKDLYYMIKYGRSWKWASKMEEKREEIEKDFHYDYKPTVISTDADAVKARIIRRILGK